MNTNVTTVKIGLDNMKVNYSELPVSCKRVVIDGDPGAGKTTLARQMASDLGFKVISLDDDKYLAGNCRPYLEQLDYESLERDIVNSEKVIIEGVCILKALATICIRYDFHIFIKALNGFLGWEMGQYLRKGVKPPCGKLARDVIEYYKACKPFEICNRILEREILK